MSDIMRPMPFEQLLKWVMTEHEKYGSVFGEHRAYKARQEDSRAIFGRKLETPVGPAAGPNTQLAQNIAAAYYTGSRFFELKTVQEKDGPELAACVNKPCILAEDEGYNCEWSTELYVSQAAEEYVKAWFLLKIMSKEFGLGSPDGFQFNISVGYNLEGIKSEKTDKFIDTMKEAEDSDIFRSCKKYLSDNVCMFKNVTRKDIEAINSDICNSATISTLHGCRPQEIEAIAMHLITKKGFNTFVKCNPTLLGYECARKTLDGMGYDYVSFGDFHFRDDLQYDDAVAMFTRLQKVSAEHGLEFGVKLTNTFPVDVKNGELPAEEMYMSGKALYPLTVSLAAKLAREFEGKLRISYSGGADAFNVRGIVDAGIWPVTAVTTLLKPGGYARMIQMARETEGVNTVFEGVDYEKAALLAREARTSPRHVKAIKPLPPRKTDGKAPLIDCFMAPCREGCPIHQDIPAYLRLTSEGRYAEAMEVITEKNPLPFITGTICPHRCMDRCTRNFYEEPVYIRQMKLVAALKGYGEWLAELDAPPVTMAGRAAVVGAGPAGMSAAYFLRKAGMAVTLFEKSGALGGAVRHVIPKFRIDEAAIDRDAAILEKLKVDIRLNTNVEDIRELKDKGFTSVVIAVGAYEPLWLHLKEGKALNAVEFLSEFKATDGNVPLGGSVAVIGGGNTAMDTARAAARNKGVGKVYLIYRRTRRYMPADEEELKAAVKEGVVFKELLSPAAIRGGKLICEVMELGESDCSGRRSVKGTGRFEEIPADTVIAAVGEKTPAKFYRENKIDTDGRGRAIVNPYTLQTNLEGVYVAGDALFGPASVVEAIRDGKKAAEAITGHSLSRDAEPDYAAKEIYERRGVLRETLDGEDECSRCLGCPNICENCVQACPNRANVSIKVKGMRQHQVVHVDYLCNECGNCRAFCPYDSAPYLDKFTLFKDEEGLFDSKNEGFAVLDRQNLKCRVRYGGETFVWTKGRDEKLPKDLQSLIEAVVYDYTYLLG